jgi:Holliday junction resolvase RusA-like endonuclease
MKMVASYVRSAYAGPLLDGPIRVLVLTFKHRPKSVSKHTMFAPVKPDHDNVSKLLDDALEGILWSNDSRIVDARVLKFFAPAGSEPWIDLLVTGIDEKACRPPTDVVDYMGYMAGESSLKCG